MKTEEYINSLIKEKDHLSELCKSHVKTILLIKRELWKLNNTITQKDKKIHKLENESLNTKIEKELTEIKNELRETAEQISRAETRFNYLTDEHLIEAQIYELRALRARYSYYLKLAKKGK